MTPTVTDALTAGLVVEAPVVPSQSISVREKPPLRLSVDARAPSGRHYRWGDDEPDPANVPSGLRFSSTMPGGYESMDCVLPRKPGTDYSDLQRLSDLTVYAAGGEVVGEYRLERTPRTSGNEMSVSPSAVGHQAHLEDDKSVRVVYVDRRLEGFRGPAAQRRADLIDADIPPTEHAVDIGDSGLPALSQALSGQWESPTVPRVESWYDGGQDLGELYYEFDVLGDAAGATWQRNVGEADDELAAGYSTLATLGGAASGSGYVTLSKRWLLLLTFYNATPGGTEGGQYGTAWKNLAVYGPHGLTKRGAAPGGLFDADIVSHALRYAPLLKWSEDNVASGFVIPHSTFPGPTTVGEIVRQTARFSLPDWAVWDDKTFYWNPRGSRGKRWRARISPAQLEETGEQVDRLWSSIVVQYADVDGSTRTVGPVGSGADTETTVLTDDDPDNPANRLGITRRDMLSMGTSTSAGAVEVGRRFLEEQKLLDRSGRAQFVGHVEDDRGVTHAAAKVRAGDYVSFVDAADTSYRRVVRASYDHGSRTCSVDLDSPPEGLAATLERLSAVLVPLGL